MAAKKERRSGGVRQPPPASRSGPAARPASEPAAAPRPGSAPTPARSGFLLPLAMRGASTGFTVLAIGQLLALPIINRFPVPAAILLVLTSTTGTVLAGMVAGEAGPPVPQGALAGAGAYVLTLPLRALAGITLGPFVLLAGPVLAAVLGAQGARLVAKVRPPDGA